jgi:hypothetical protein
LWNELRDGTGVEPIPRAFCDEWIERTRAVPRFVQAGPGDQFLAGEAVQLAREEAEGLLLLPREGMWRPTTRSACLFRSRD